MPKSKGRKKGLAHLKALARDRLARAVVSNFGRPRLSRRERRVAGKPLVARPISVEKEAAERRALPRRFNAERLP